MRTRADLDELPAHVPGRSLPKTIKLAGNEVSGGPLPSVIEALTRASADIHRYPDMMASELTDCLAKRLRVDPAQVVVGCGSVALCRQLVEATCTADDNVVLPWPSFEAYPVLTRAIGAQPVVVPLTGTRAVDPDAMLRAITPETRLVFVCNPNNPTGTMLRAEQLERFLDAVPSDVVVVLDEAYFEFVTDTEAPDGVEFVRARGNVVAVRTFSKAYGLAGLRVGYAVAPPGVADAMRKVCIPFSINALAQAAATASLDAHSELEARCGEVIAERMRVRADLVGLGYEIPESQGNFLWLPLGTRSAAFEQHCFGELVMIRRFGEDGARVTIGTPDENDALIAAAKSFPG